MDFIMAQELGLGRVSFVRPGGNDTAIVWDQIPRKEQSFVANRILKNYQSIEQVMFAELVSAIERQPLYRGQMAGGEFCGNASRALGFLLLEGQDGVIQFPVSGVDRSVQVICSGGGAEIEIPVNQNFSCVDPIGNGDYIVYLNGIVHYVMSQDTALGKDIRAEPSVGRRKDMAFQFLQSVGLTDYNAAGLMILSSSENAVYQLDPYVYVRDTQTLYHETACGSGSAAVGMVFAISSGQSVFIDLKQPSQSFLRVNVIRDQSFLIQSKLVVRSKYYLMGRLFFPLSPVCPTQL